MTFTGGRWNRDRPHPAQFSPRIAVLGAFALIAFSIIFFRLWYLQVLSGDRYLAEAQGNRVREVTVQAPRGDILDRDGKVLVGNRTALALQVRAEELPRGANRRAKVLERVAVLAEMPLSAVRKEIRVQTLELPSNPVTLRRDVRDETVYYLRENQSRYPGVTVDRVYVRRYPHGTLGAHLFGYVREVSAEQLEEPRYQELQPGDQVGQAGVEQSYDHVLRGINGVTRIPVDASGTPTGREASVREPSTGNDLVLTIDSSLQAAGEAALQGKGLPGGFVAMSVEDGEILALGSNPTYDPKQLTKQLSPAESAEIFGDPEADPTEGLAPFFNRAIAAGYPTGSTFKPITALAALDAGMLTPGETINDPGSIKIGDIEFINAGRTAYGPVNLRKALQVSSDVFFYTMGARLNGEIEDKQWLQDWANSLALGAPTGIDIPGEGSGLVPSPEWRNDLYRQGLTDRPWSIGDNVNLSVGQGDLQADPLQMAVAYAAIGNGGEIVRPHLGLRAEDPAGRVVQEIEPAPRREVEIDPEWRRAILDGLRAAAMEPGGTSAAIFAGFPVDIAGKTGTAETSSGYDQSWYVALAPAEDPRIVVALTIERGGFGADAAAPAVFQMLSEYFRVGAEDIKEGAESAAEAGTVVYE